nr:hypothetical protein Iba_chr05bCG2060 [Ipomoea batatas]
MSERNIDLNCEFVVPSQKLFEALLPSSSLRRRGKENLRHQTNRESKGRIFEAKMIEKVASGRADGGGGVSTVKALLGFGTTLLRTTILIPEHQATNFSPQNLVVWMRASNYLYIQDHDGAEEVAALKAGALPELYRCLRHHCRNQRWFIKAHVILIPQRL